MIQRNLVGNIFILLLDYSTIRYMIIILLESIDLTFAYFPLTPLVEKKPAQPRVSGGERNVKFSGESREERNNRRNREDGERTLRGQGEFRRGPPGLVSAKQPTNVIR